MKRVLVDYLAEKALADLRENRGFDEELSNAFNQYPLIDALRDLVEEVDIPILMELAATQNNEFGLAVSLLRKFDTRTDVKSFLLDQWKKRNDYDHRLQLMWRILDDVNLDESIHEDIYIFVTSHFNRFVKDSIEWYGGADQVLGGIQARLSDPSFPQTKDWVYLCSAMGSSDKKSVIELLRTYMRDSNGFVQKVASNMMQKLEHEQA